MILSPSHIRGIVVTLVGILFTISLAELAHGETAAPLRLVLVGDSTVCEYPAQRPDRGWGQFLAEHFKPGSVIVINHAAAGRSSKTFILEKRWQKTLVEKPDYVFIQFGHNDSHEAGKPESTTATGDYSDYLRKYVDDARSAGATPVLITPMVRRTFDADGRQHDILGPYADAMKAVAREKNCSLVDLHASSRELVEKLGPAHAQELANKRDDFTHFNEQGARAMAGLITRDLPSAESRLGALLKKP